MVQKSPKYLKSWAGMEACWVMERFYLCTVVIVMQMYTFVKSYQKHFKKVFVFCVKSYQKNKLFFILCQKIVGIEMVIYLVQPGRNKLKLTLEAVSKWRWDYSENYKTHREIIHFEQKLASNKQQDGITIPTTSVKTSIR